MIVPFILHQYLSLEKYRKIISPCTNMHLYENKYLT